jgi:hypothetical protein
MVFKRGARAVTEGQISETNKNQAGKQNSDKRPFLLLNMCLKFETKISGLFE